MKALNDAVYDFGMRVADSLNKANILPTEKGYRGHVMIVVYEEMRPEMMPMGGSLNWEEGKGWKVDLQLSQPQRVDFVEE